MSPEELAEHIGQLQDSLRGMEETLDRIYGLISSNPKSWQYRDEVYNHIKMELELRKRICDKLIPFYFTGLLPEESLYELDKDIALYRRLNTK